MQVYLGPAIVVHFKPQVEVASSNPFESVFAIYKPDFEVMRIFTNLSEKFSRWWTTPSGGSWKIRILGEWRKVSPISPSPAPF